MLTCDLFFSVANLFVLPLMLCLLSVQCRFSVLNYFTLSSHFLRFGGGIILVFELQIPLLNLKGNPVSGDLFTPKVPKVGIICDL